MWICVEKAARGPGTWRKGSARIRAEGNVRSCAFARILWTSEGEAPSVFPGLEPRTGGMSQGEAPGLACNGARGLNRSGCGGYLSKRGGGGGFIFRREEGEVR